MKFQSFINELLQLIQKDTRIHLPTFKLILNSFFSHLSEKEKLRWYYQINILTSFTTVQQTIEQNLIMNKTKELENQLKHLKKDD